MTAGLQITNDGAVIQIDETYRNIQLITKVAVTAMTQYTADPDKTYWYYDITVTGGVAPILAINGNPTTYVIAGPPVDAGSGTFYFRVFSPVDADFTYYIFDYPTASGTFGLEVSDATGALAYTSGRYPFKPVSVIDTLITDNLKTTTLSSGPTYAVVTLKPGVKGFSDSYIGEICTGSGAFCQQDDWMGGFKVDANVIYSHAWSYQWRHTYQSGSIYCGIFTGDEDQQLLILDVTGA